MAKRNFKTKEELFKEIDEIIENGEVEPYFVQEDNEEKIIEEEDNEFKGLIVSNSDDIVFLIGEDYSALHINRKKVYDCDGLNDTMEIFTYLGIKYSVLEISMKELDSVYGGEYPDVLI